MNFKPEQAKNEDSLTEIEIQLPHMDYDNLERSLGVLLQHELELSEAESLSAEGEAKLKKIRDLKGQVQEYMQLQH